MAKEKVTIKATEAVQKWASDAMQIQDACNARAVTNFLAKVMDYFSDVTSNGHGGLDIAAQNPITVAIINKLCHLAQMEQSLTPSFDACGELAAGRNVEWTILFRN
jgi:hypothetical protein